MPKNKGAGGKNRRKGKTANEHTKPMVFKEEGEEYGQIIKSLGNGYMEVLCFSDNGNVARRGHIRGNMRKKVWLSVGDVVLVNIREFQENTCDIIFKYTSDEARILRNRSEIPDDIEINKIDGIDDDQYVVTFEKKENQYNSRSRRNHDSENSDS